jgi:hypothetical protein
MLHFSNKFMGNFYCFLIVILDYRAFDIFDSLFKPIRKD